MSNFHRKGTVSKASGPTHANSYAMKNVPVRYKTPIFVPELLQLPVNWVKPTLPSSRNFNYDFSLEHRVSEQARHRAVSIAAEASLQRKQITAMLESQKNSAGETTADSAPPRLPHPPFLSSTDILTPTPVAPPAGVSQSSPVVVERGINLPAAKGGDQSGSSSAEGGSSTSLIEEESQPVARGLDKAVFKSLGNWSIKEFEGDAMDPFEIASLQAINDMEELQSVLQQTPPPQTTPSTSAAAVTIAAASVAAPPVVPVSASSPTMLESSQSRVPVTAIPHYSSEPMAVVHSSPSGGPLPSRALPSSPGMLRSGVISSPMETGVAAGGPPLSSSPLAQTHSSNAMAPSNQFGSAFPRTNPFYPGPVTTSVAPAGTTNPFQNNVSFMTPVSENTSTPNLQHHQQQLQQPTQEPQRNTSEPGVGTLVDLGDLLGGTSASATNHPVPAPRNSPKIQRPLPSSSAPTTVTTQGANSPVPVPKPRSSRGSPAPQPRPTPPTAATPTPTPPTTGLSQSSSTSGLTRGLPPPVAPKNSSPKTTPARISSGSPNFSTTHNHVSMGVPVLPGIALPTTCSQATPPSEPPPAYKQNATPPTGHKGSPPPPYSSPTVYRHPQQPPPPTSVRPPPTCVRPPQVAPKAYVLPNPEASLTMEERAQVQSMAGMGFPPHRVGRAMLRFQGDQTKVLDFLFLVGELEEAKFNGNSAETALIACKDNVEEAKAYLQQLQSYKEFGFPEKQIHEAYNTGKGDWNKVLDILTKER